MKVWVSNIPVQGYATAEVEIPDDAAEDEEKMQEAIAEATNDLGSSALMPGLTEVEPDDGCIDSGWEFQYEVMTAGDKTEEKVNDD